MTNIRFWAVFVFLGLIFVPITPAKADTTGVAAVIVAAAKADIPVILPTNPFYFAKEFTREVRRFFTFGAVNKAAYELEVADEKALEVREVEKISPNNAKAINRAIENYTTDVARLKERLESLDTTSSDARVDSLLSTLEDKVIEHTELLGELKTNDAVKDTAAEAATIMIDAATSAPIKLDVPQEGTAIETVTTVEGEAATAVDPATATTSVAVPSVTR